MIAQNFLAVADRLGLPRSHMFAVIGLGIAQSLFEAGAVMMLLPVLQYIQAGGDVSMLVQKHAHWQHILGLFQFFGQPVSLAGLLSIAFLAVIGRQFMQYSQRVITARARSGLLYRIRARLFQGFLNADLASAERDVSGRVLADFTTEADTAATALFYSLQALILVGIFLVYLTGLFILSWQLTIFSIALMAVTTLLLQKLLRRSRTIGNAVTVANQDVGAFLVERLKSIRLIRLSRTEVPELKMATSLLADQRRHSSRLPAVSA